LQGHDESLSWKRTVDTAARSATIGCDARRILGGASSGVKAARVEGSRPPARDVRTLAARRSCFGHAARQWLVAGKVRKWKGRLLDVDLRRLRRELEDSRDFLFSAAGVPQNLFRPN
jgi:hypothetical protein